MLWTGVVVGLIGDVAVNRATGRATLRRRPRQVELAPEPTTGQLGHEVAANDASAEYAVPAIVMTDGLVPEDVNARAVILAGGRGTRLAPYTSILPKPLMPIGTARSSRSSSSNWGGGFHDIALSVGYLAHLIQAVFDNAGPARPRKAHSRPSPTCTRSATRNRRLAASRRSGSVRRSWS